MPVVAMSPRRFSVPPMVLFFRSSDGTFRATFFGPSDGTFRATFFRLFRELMHDTPSPGRARS